MPGVGEGGGAISGGSFGDESVAASPLIKSDWSDFPDSESESSSSDPILQKSDGVEEWAWVSQRVPHSRTNTNQHINICAVKRDNQLAWKWKCSIGAVTSCVEKESFNRRLL